MSVVLITPNMNLPNPIPTTTPGPEWSYDINSCLTIVDSHDHSAGKGVQITPNGLNINDDLEFQGNNASVIRAIRFDPQATSIPNSGLNVAQIYVAGNELYYNDYTGGNIVQITTNGSVNAGAGSITGLPSGTASASYSSGTFTWQSATNTAANMDFASAILRNATASSFGLTLQAPAAMGANFSLTLPNVPVATKIMQLDSSGNMLAALAVDNSTIEISSNTLEVKALGIDTAQIANGAVTLAKLASSILQWNTTTVNSNGTFVVPSGVITLIVEAFGGGGGGGGGGSASAPGGGGGGGAPVFSRILSVTAGETLTIVIGTGGAGGAAQVDGTSGVSTTITGGTSGLLLTCIGGGGGGSGQGAAVPHRGLDSIGSGGAGNASSAAGGGGGGGGMGPGGTSVVVVANAASFGGSNGGGGAGGFNSTGGTGGATEWSTTRSVAGTGDGTGGGGGGGGNSFGAGGAGGNGAATPVNGGTASANTGGGGGGGGGSGDAGAGAVGGTGGSGKVIIRWLGAP